MAPPEGDRLVDPTSGEFEQPPDVAGADEVPRRTHHVRAEDSAVVERALDVRVGDDAAHPHRERPLGGAVILSLDGAKPGDEAGRVGLCRRREALALQPLCGNPGDA